jgi:hypothetical protein
MATRGRLWGLRAQAAVAVVFHNLPKEMYGWGSWNPDKTRAGLRHYQIKHADRQGFDYVTAFNNIFGEDIQPARL